MIGTSDHLCWLAEACEPVSPVQWQDPPHLTADFMQGLHLQGRKNHCVAVIGDGAITGGMAYEAMNHAGFLDKNMIVVLNDNQQVCPTPSAPLHVVEGQRCSRLLQVCIVCWTRAS